MDIESLLEDMVRRGATDLYLSAGNPPIFRSAGNPPIFRSGGTLYPADGAPALTPQGVETLVDPFLAPGQKQAAWESSGIRWVGIRWVGIRWVGIRRNAIAVEGEVFPDGDCLAAAFHRVVGRTGEKNGTRRT